MGFWDNALGGGTPAPPRQEVPGYTQSQPWFRSDTGYQQAQGGNLNTPQGYPQGYPQPQVDPHEEASRRKAMSAKSTMSCPNCGSDHIFKPSGMPNAMEQCYTCGWNPRFEHSTANAGMPSTAETGPARPSRQVSTANNFNPQTIVAKISG